MFLTPFLKTIFFFFRRFFRKLFPLYGQYSRAVCNQERAMIALVRQKTTYFTISTILITVRSPEYTAKMFLVFQILITSPISPMDPAMVFEHLTFFVTIDRISNQTTGSHKSCRMESARFNSVQPKDKFSLSTYLKWILYKF